ncbi:MAG: arginine decarboxylase, pyruvoyl-dependent [Methanocalculaceae archaeon]|jgi:arginine decarboxylase|nr:arginine decarboxylase, pyruvoyl-dependent [Methanocalculaceae archaeon]
MVIPEKVFFTKGCGVHKDELTSFEMALRDAKISQYNLVTVSSILPPGANVISCEEGLSYLSPGEIVYCVMSRAQTNEQNRQVSAAVGLAIPENHDKQHGYLSEHHTYGMTQLECGDYAEDLAATMLATTLGIPFNLDADWQELEQVFLASGKIIKTSNICASVVCGPERQWTTVVAAAVLILPKHG